MSSVLPQKSRIITPTGSDAGSAAGSFDSSARLDVQAAMMRNQTCSATAWRTWDNQNAPAPEEFPVVGIEGTESTESPE